MPAYLYPRSWLPLLVGAMLETNGADSAYPPFLLAPGDVLTRSEPNATLLAAARATVVAVNSAEHWAPLNGLCMSWPPAIRIRE